MSGAEFLVATTKAEEARVRLSKSARKAEWSYSGKAAAVVPPGASSSQCGRSISGGVIECAFLRSLRRRGFQQASGDSFKLYTSSTSHEPISQPKRRQRGREQRGLGIGGCRGSASFVSSSQCGRRISSVPVVVYSSLRSLRRRGFPAGYIR
jgi:hypothetical protein